jgi:hypothetical protein
VRELDAIYWLNELTACYSIPAPSTQSPRVHHHYLPSVVSSSDRVIVFPTTITVTPVDLAVNAVSAEQTWSSTLELHNAPMAERAQWIE